MQVDDQVLINIQKFCQHLIRKLRRQDLQIGDSPDGISHLECISVPEHKTGRCHIILCIESCPDHGSIVKLEICHHIRIECLIQDLQTFHAIQRICRNSQNLKVIQDIRLDTFQLWFCLPDIFCFNGKCDIF